MTVSCLILDSQGKLQEVVVDFEQLPRIRDLIKLEGVGTFAVRAVMFVVVPHAELAAIGKQKKVYVNLDVVHYVMPTP